MPRLDTAGLVTCNRPTGVLGIDHVAFAAHGFKTQKDPKAMARRPHLLVETGSPRFVAYLRVSTDRQGKSGLGLEA
jgi:hypothetical protein